MAQDEDPTAFDVDALQAQIDLAMSMTEELVSTWVKPSANSKPNLVQKKRTYEETERELQAYMKRPSRLGVGTPIPDSNGPGTREATTLRSKLAGSNKKHGNQSESARFSKVNGAVDDDGEEEETKGSSVPSTSLKRTRVDPFSTPRKKAKQAPQLSNEQKASSSSTAAGSISAHTVGFPARQQGNGDAIAGAKFIMPEGEAIQTPRPSPKTEKVKRRKGKDSKAVEISFANQSTDPGPAHPGETSTVKMNGILPSPISSGVPTLDDNSTSGVDVDEEEEWTGFSVPALEEVTKESNSGPRIGKGLKLPVTHFLNLDGPPLDDVEEQGAEVGKSKRKRRRKKKHKDREGIVAS